VCVCVLETSRMRRPWPALGRSATGEKTTIWYIRNVALCGGEIWALQKIYQKYRESFDLWCSERMEKIVDGSCEK